jgi:hypothetical protein
VVAGALGVAQPRLTAVHAVLGVPSPRHIYGDRNSGLTEIYLLLRSGPLNYVS